MDQIFCVRAEFGKYTDSFVGGGYVAIGWFSEEDLSAISSREELEEMYANTHPNEAKNILTSQHLDQTARFLFELKAGDFVFTPSLNTEHIYYGVVRSEPCYYYDSKGDNCPFPHRKSVIWSLGPIPTKVFSSQFQNAIHSSLTIFPINQKQNFLDAIQGSSFEVSQGG